MSVKLQIIRTSTGKNASIVQILFNLFHLSENGGPLISLETTEAEDCMAIVWKSIPSSQKQVDGMLLLLLLLHAIFPCQGFDDACFSCCT